jgi:hypothetical protein
VTTTTNTPEMTREEIQAELLDLSYDQILACAKRLPIGEVSKLYWACEDLLHYSSVIILDADTMLERLKQDLRVENPSDRRRKITIDDMHSICQDVANSDWSYAMDGVLEAADVAIERYANEVYSEK